MSTGGKSVSRPARRGGGAGVRPPRRRGERVESYRVEPTATGYRRVNNRTGKVDTYHAPRDGKPAYWT